MKWCSSLAAGAFHIPAFAANPRVMGLPHDLVCLVERMIDEASGPRNEALLACCCLRARVRALAVDRPQQMASHPGDRTDAVCRSGGRLLSGHLR